MRAQQTQPLRTEPRLVRRLQPQRSRVGARGAGVRVREGL